MHKSTKRHKITFRLLNALLACIFCRFQKIINHAYSLQRSLLYFLMSIYSFSGITV